jgi:hypothetical protein
MLLMQIDDDLLHSVEKSEVKNESFVRTSSVMDLLEGYFQPTESFQILAESQRCLAFQK